MDRIIIEALTPKIESFCAKWRIRELSMFGSAISGGLKPQSDVDLLVTFEDGAAWTFFDFAAMQDEMEELFGRKVDLVSRKGLESSRNHIRKDAILSSAQVLYAA